MRTRIPLVRICTLIALVTAAVILSAAGTASAGNICQQTCPSVQLTKSGPNFVIQGQTAKYTFSVYNNGTVAFTNVSVTDDKCSPLVNTTDPADADNTLSPTETWTFECSYAPPGEPGDEVVNTATFTGDYGDGQHFGPITAYHVTTIAGLTITKDVNLASADPFDTLNYTVTITDTGPDDFNYVGYVNDDHCYLQSEGQQSNSFNLNGTGQTIVFHCSIVYDPEQGNPLVNTACLYAQIQRQEVVAREGATTDGFQSDVSACDDASTSLAKHVATGQVFEDMNADGARQQDEPVLPGMVIYADLNNNGVRDEGEPSATSDGQGNYTLEVQLGSTTIREDVPGGFTCSFPAGCAYTVNLPKNSPPPPPTDRSIHPKAADPSGLDFGDWRPVSISGTVVNDANGNGTRDAGESGLAGAVVFVDLNGNGSLDDGEPRTDSAADGAYFFGGLKPGSYVVRQSPPASFTCTAPAGCNHSVALQSNGAATGRDFLDTAPAQVVLPSRITPGRASMSGQTGCVSAKGFSARVRGTKILNVKFYVDGKFVKSLGKPSNGVFAYRVNVKRLKVGSHEVAAHVTFTTSSRTKSKTLRVNFQRCAGQLRAPQFTG